MNYSKLLLTLSLLLSGAIASAMKPAITATIVPSESENALPADLQTQSFIYLKNLIPVKVENYSAQYDIFTALAIDNALNDTNRPFREALIQRLKNKRDLDRVSDAFARHLKNQPFHGNEATTIYNLLSPQKKGNLVSLELIHDKVINLEFGTQNNDQPTILDIKQRLENLRPNQAIHFLAYDPTPLGRYPGDHILFSIATDNNNKATLYLIAPKIYGINANIRKYIDIFLPLINQFNSKVSVSATAAVPEKTPAHLTNALPADLANKSVVFLKNLVPTEGTDSDAYVVTVTALALNNAAVSAKDGSSFVQRLSQWISENYLHIRTLIADYIQTRDPNRGNQLLNTSELRNILDDVIKANNTAVVQYWGDGQLRIPSLFAAYGADQYGPSTEGKSPEETNRILEEKRVNITKEKVTNLIKALQGKANQVANFAFYNGKQITLASIVTDANKKATLYVMLPFVPYEIDATTRKFIDMLSPYVDKLNKGEKI